MCLLLQLQKATDLLKERGESLPKELEFQEPEKTVSSSIKKNSVSNDVDEDPVAAERRDKVKDAMLHAWSSYEKYAWGMDELMVLHLSLTTYYSFLSKKHNLRWKLLLEY